MAHAHAGREEVKVATEHVFSMQITYNDMPLLLVGAYDCFVSFHPAVIALTTSETEQEYSQVLQLADDAVCSH